MDLKNQYEIKNGKGYVTVRYKDKVFTTVVDEIDMVLLLSIKTTWVADYKKNSDKYYIRASIDGKLIQLHRYLTGAIKGEIVDHKDGDTFNNTRENLRITNKSGNAQNTGLRADNKTGVKGVWRDKSRNKWVAEIRTNGVKQFLGRFDDIEEAKRSVEKARAEQHPLAPVK